MYLLIGEVAGSYRVSLEPERKFIELLLGLWIIDKDKTWNNLYLELLFYFCNIKVVPFKVSI